MSDSDYTEKCPVCDTDREIVGEHPTEPRLFLICGHDIVNDNRIYCVQCKDNRTVVETSETQGFGAGTVTVIDLECSHQITDDDSYAEV